VPSNSSRRCRAARGHTPAPESQDLVQAAFEAFQRANSIEEIRQAAAQYPFMTDPQFIAAIEQLIQPHVPPELQPAFRLRLEVLKAHRRYARLVKAEDVAANNYNLDIKNPNRQDDYAHMPPEQLARDIAAKEARIAEIMAEIQAVLKAGA